MKVFFVGVFTPNSTNNSLAKGFERAGVETVFRYDYREGLRSAGSVSLRDKYLCALIREKKPDLTVFAKCNQMGVEPVFEAKKTGRACLWYMDPKNGNFNAELTEKIKAADVSCFALQAPLEAAKDYSSNVFFVPEGYDEAVDIPPQEHVQKQYSLSFIGNPRGERKSYLEKLGFALFTNVHGSDHARTVWETRINLNFTEGGTSDRTYKVMAAGGFLLTQPWPGMEDMFVPGQHLDVFTSPEDLEAKANYYLMNSERREEIAFRGHAAAVIYSRQHWAEQILNRAGLS